MYLHICWQEASRIRQEADKTKEKATYLKDEADNLSEDVNNLEKDIAQREKQADDDSALTNDVSIFFLPSTLLHMVTVCRDT